jgi:hypothetical protein
VCSFFFSLRLYLSILVLNLVACQIELKIIMAEAHANVPPKKNSRIKCGECPDTFPNYNNYRKHLADQNLELSSETLTFTNKEGLYSKFSIRQLYFPTLHSYFSAFIFSIQIFGMKMENYF